MCVLPSVSMCACHRQLARPCAQVKSRLISTSEREVIQPPLWIITGRCEDVSPLCPLYVSNENKLILFPKSSQLSLQLLLRRQSRTRLSNTRTTPSAKSVLLGEFDPRRRRHLGETRRPETKRPWINFKGPVCKIWLDSWFLYSVKLHRLPINTSIKVYAHITIKIIWFLDL